MTPGERNAARESWHGKESTEVIADRYGVSVGSMKMFWQREKKAGRLPDTPRPNIERAPVKVAACVADTDDDDDDALFGGAPIVMPTGDPLLETLQAHHGVMRADLPPIAWLRTYPRRNNYSEAGLGSSLQHCEPVPPAGVLKDMRQRSDAVFSFLHNRQGTAA